MGRKTKPTADKRLKGTARDSRENKNEPKYEIAGVEPSEIIASDDYALEEWERVIGGLVSRKVLAVPDIATLERYCKLHSRWREAEENIITHGDVIKTPNGMLQQSPYVGMANQAAINANKLASELGLTPSARAKVSGIKDSGIKPNDPWSGM